MNRIIFFLLIIIKLKVYSQGVFTNYTAPVVIYSGVFEDNNIWITTSGGVIKFDTLTKNFQTYNSYNSGLPCTSVFSVAIDSSKNKWFATGGGPKGYAEITRQGRGLVKYDGTNWTVYNKANSGLPENSVRDVYIDSLQNVWAGTLGGGLALYTGTTWTVYDRANSAIPSDSVTSIAVDKNGIKWIGTFKGVASFDGTTWTTYNSVNSPLVSDTVRHIEIGPNNEKWIGTISGVSKFDGVLWDTYKTSNSGLPYDNVINILAEPNGNVWFATSGVSEQYAGGIAKFDGISTWTVYDTLNSGLPKNNTCLILSDPNGGKWISSQRGQKAGEGYGQINKFDGVSDWKTYPLSSNSLMVNYLYRIAIDAANNKWIGGEKGGLTVFDGTSWQNYNTINSSISDDDNYCIKFDASGNLWTSHDRGRLDKFDGVNFITFNTPGGVIDDPYSFVIDSNDDKWIACRGSGIYKFDGTAWTSYTSANSGLPDDNVNCVELDAAENKWFGTGNGLAMFDGTTWTVYNTSNSGLPNKVVYDIAFDQGGNKWIATGNGLAMFDGVTWTIYKTTNSAFTSNLIYSVSIDANDVKWVGTQAGVAKLQGTTWTNIKSFVGSPYDLVLDINFDLSGNIWYTTNGAGLIKYDPDSTLNVSQANRLKDKIFNYPNPFSDKTSISLLIPNNNYKCELKIYDSYGRKVNSIYSISYLGEKIDITIFSEGLENGLYIYELISDQSRFTGKFILEK